MPLTVTHTFSSSIADNPAAALLGKVLPSKWNDNHNVSGSIAANEVTNIPAAPITATDVQAAINQLASLIPAPGPGTDPLLLIHGLNIDTIEPTFSGDATNRYAANIKMVTDISTTQPQFTNSSVFTTNLYATHGQNIYSVQTQSKHSFFNINNFAQYNAAGQHFNMANTLYAFGMGDSATYAQQYVSFAGGPINGDEGQGWGLASNLTQQPFLVITTITAVPAQNTINTTLTNQVLLSKDLQTVVVGSTAGLLNDGNDWVVVGQEIPNQAPNVEAVHVISFTPTTITGIFRNNHQPGTTITPALRLFGGAMTYYMGQDRVLVNMSAPSYSTGQVTNIIGGGFIGTGTNWTESMVGGYALNIGAITLECDDEVGYPFDAGANRLRSWYQIDHVFNPTDLGAYRTSVAGAGNYIGKGPIQGQSVIPTNYVIRPCAKVLHLVTGANGSITGELICETSTSTWTVGDTIEQVICPYPDITGFQYRMGTYTNGSLFRFFMGIANAGSRTIDVGFGFQSGFRHASPTGDLVDWNVCYAAAECNYGIDISLCRKGAVHLYTPQNTGAALTDLGGSIVWDNAGEGGGGMLLGPDSTDLALKLYTIGLSDVGALRFARFSTPTNPDTGQVVMNWQGWIHLLATTSAGVKTPYIYLDNTIDQTNFERSFWRWNSNVLEFGTEKGAGGTGRDVALKADGAEILRLIAGSNIKFTAPANFSANGSVATTLGSVGPAGAGTTVQKWLTFVDDTGATRYVPCF